MKHYTLSLLFISISLLVQGQNMVPNGNFEQYTSCPTSPNGGQLNNCVSWTNVPWTNGIVDYFNSCATHLAASVPNNNHMYLPAASGNAYIGITTYNSSNPQKDYGAIEIVPMTPNMLYEVSASVCLSGATRYASDNLGIFFHKAPISYTATSTAPAYVPQLSFGYIADTQWVRMSKVFRADSAYSHMIIGGFVNNPGPLFSQVVNGRPGVYVLAYYFIDSLVIKPMKVITSSDTVTCQGDSLELTYNVNAFVTGTKLLLELSNSMGNFASPVILDTIISSSSGSFKTFIPPNILPGAAYRLRLVKQNPLTVSFDNGYDIRIKPLPQAFTATSNNPVCEQDTIKLFGSSVSTGVSYVWSGPGGFSAVTGNAVKSSASINNTGDYILTATLNGCFISDTLAIDVQPLPNKPTASAGTSALCEGATLSLLASSSTTGVTYSWSGPGGFTSNIAAPTRTGTIAQWSGDYIVHTTLNGCTSRDTVNVLIQPSPDKPTAGSNSPICVGGILNLTASTVAGATYEWSGPAGFGTTQQNPTRQNVALTYGGKYAVVTKMNGCTSAADTATVVVNAGPQVGMYPNPGDTICTGWDVTFTATPQNAGANPTFEWYRNGAFTGNSGLTYKTNAVSHGDTFTVRMNSSACNTAITSKPVRMNILPTQDPPTISIAATPGTHVWPWVEVTFKASTTKAGAKPGYQWKRNGADIPNGKDSILKMTDLKAGDTVCCVVTSNFLCAEPREVLSNCLVMNVDLSIGNQAKSTTGIRLYPNPTTGSFTLESQAAGTLVIGNLQGQEVAEYEIKSGKNTLVMPAALGTGVYFGKIFPDSQTNDLQGIEVLKIVLER